MPRVFRRHKVSALKGLDSPQCDIAEVADRRSDNVKHSVSSDQNRCYGNRRNEPPLIKPARYCQTNR
jgi:hypothetical protein